MSEPVPEPTAVPEVETAEVPVEVPAKEEETVQVVDDAPSAP